MKNKIDVYNTEKKVIEKIDLNSDIVCDKINFSLLKQAILMYEANERQGTASTKTKGEVRGGGKKPWRQKGTGRARVGSIRSPIWRGGGITFGPKPRDYSYSIPKKAKKKALDESLKVKLQDDEIILLDKVVCKDIKTKNITDILKKFELENKNKILLVLDGIDNNVVVSSRNISSLEVKPVSEINSYDILKSECVLIAKAAFLKLAEFCLA